VTLWVELGPLTGYAWLGDSRLAFAPADGGLALLTPDDLASRAFIVSQERMVTLPIQRPDGSVAFFVHDEVIDGPGFLNTGGDDGSFRQEGTIPVVTAGWEWSADGSRLVRPGDEPDSITLLDPLSGSQATFKAAGVPISFDWSELPPERVSGLPLPTSLYFLAPQAGIIQVWRLPGSGDPPVPLTGATSDVLDYAISDDGTRLAFTSNGSLYFAQLGTEVLVKVADLSATEPPTTHPAFSPDGDLLAYADRGIWVANLLTGEIQRLVADLLPSEVRPETQIQLHDTPLWSPDGQWLLITVNFYEGYDLALIPADRPASEPTLLELFNSQAQWTQDGLVLAYSVGGGYAPPHLSLVQPGESPAISHLLSLPILDAAVRPDRRIGLVRIPSPYSLGPTSAQVYSALADGSGLQAESDSFVLDAPRISPDAVLVAGLYNARVDEFGQLSGQLALVNPATGEMFVIEGVVGVRDLRWGR
jgi:hypothetical protein